MSITRFALSHPSLKQWLVPLSASVIATVALPVVALAAFGAWDLAALFAVIGAKLFVAMVVLSLPVLFLVRVRIDTQGMSAPTRWLWRRRIAWADVRSVNAWQRAWWGTRYIEVRDDRGSIWIPATNGQWLADALTTLGIDCAATRELIGQVSKI